MAPASKAQQRAVSKYMKENYDEIKVRVPKGQKEVIQAHAEAQGKSTNAFINEAIDEKMERDEGENMENQVIETMTLKELAAEMKTLGCGMDKGTLAAKIEAGHYKEFAECVRLPGSSRRYITIYKKRFFEWAERCF